MEANFLAEPSFDESAGRLAEPASGICPVILAATFKIKFNNFI